METAKPLYIRIPKAGTRCPVTGLSRATMYQLISAGHIKSAVVSHEGKKRGTRYVKLQSIEDYLEKRITGSHEEGRQRVISF